jgi:hypothetical protein
MAFALEDQLCVPLWAVRDSQLAKGRYPVLIYAPSDSSVSWENADLCEYLASHGYVVLASPSLSWVFFRFCTPGDKPSPYTLTHDARHYHLLYFE